MIRINLEKLKESHKTDLLNYNLLEGQDKFTAIPSIVFERISKRENIGDFTAIPVTIIYDNIPVGLFVLDFGNDRFVFTENKNSILLKALSINPKYQGKGIAKKAMELIPNFINEGIGFSDIEEIVLAVNIKNKNAYRLYRKVGYFETGQAIIGNFGLQRIMKCEI